ncbi:uncharacterized protein LOC107016701 [Solanum pennellii]|uniref:Uncharacterized protein LOC107016701 n=1 Tax=Solanum pennellii TaxID=28526 RepID=A0ABM1GKY6_SOLPN|nr:uncharacterized protein LOC107016701 [Solanum pennellii]
MKLSDYSVVEQLRKTPAQISLLSLLIHSDEHRKAVMKILNEAHVPSKVTVSQLEKIAGRIFEVNRITFSDDELPKEGSGANICPLSTLQKLNVSAERVRPTNVCVRAFDGSKTDVIGEIELIPTIGPVDFAVNFQVLDINSCYNLLLGRPWVHRAGAVPSTLHQMIKFEYDRQEVIVHGEGDLSIYKDSSSHFIKVDNENEALVYQDFEVVVIEHVSEGSVISKPNLPIASVMVVNELLKHGFEPGKGLGICLQGRSYPVSLRKSIGSFGLGYQPRVEDKMKAKKQKRDVWSLTKPIQPIYKSFIKARATESYQSSFPEPVMKVSEEMINYFQDLFVEVDMVEIGEGTSDRDVQLIGPDVNLNNWEATPLPVKDESCSFYADSSDMTCMQNFSPDLNIQSNLRPNIEIISQEIEHDEDRVFEEVRRDFNHFENKSNPNMSETETINLGDQEIIKETKISVHLHQKNDIIQALFDYKDIFASSYDDMPGLSTDMVVHKLPIDSNFPPIKQKLRKLKTDMSVIIKEEITKQLEAKVIQVSQYPSWLANIVRVPKKDGKVRMCVDYRDLNKASRKDDFPLPNIHILLDNCAKHEVASFLDCYVGYHQIIMDDEDAEKTSIITPWGPYCYRVMPFGLKNAGATYMRAMTTTFHDMSNHVKDLRRFFERLRMYNLKLNPAKCVFGVPLGKLLGFIVSRRGIELDPSKIKAIQELPPPKNKTEVMILLGRLNYISRFIAQLTTTCEPIFKLLKKNATVEWTEECREAFERIKNYLSNPPVLVPPEPGRPLILYMSVLDNSFGCVLGQHDDTGKKEQAIYYLSKKFTVYEVKYTLLERTCCALTWCLTFFLCKRVENEHKEKAGGRVEVAFVGGDQAPPQAPTSGMQVPGNPAALTDGEVRESLVYMAQAITTQAQAITAQATREVYKILCAMGVNEKEKAELAAYQLKDVSQMWYKMWADDRAPEAVPITWDILTTFLERFFPIEQREAKVEEFINLRQEGLCYMHNMLRRVFGEREAERARNLGPRISPVRAMLIIRFDSPKFKKGHKHSGNPTPSNNTYADGDKSESKKGNDRNAQRDREPCGKCGRLHGGE